MRGPHQLKLVLLTILLASTTGALAQEVTDELERPSAWQRRSLRVGAAALRTSLSNDPDTVWIGHIADPAWVPKDRNGNPVPSSPRDANGAPTVPGTVPVGGHGPHHVGRGANFPGGDVSMSVPGGAGTHWNGVWDFDHFQAGDDSLQGWWPIARPGQHAGANNSDDKVRAFFGLNYGNNGNYVINQGTKRTFGVTGYWHRDAGDGAPAAYVDGTPASPGPNVEWAPIGGTQSAWCGLRANDDFNAIDPVGLGGTGNPINQRVLEFNGHNSLETGAVNTAGGTDRNFPGYGSQWDQILYRDVNLSGVGVGQTVTISFKYVHALSPVRGDLSSLSRIGYFWKDPVRPTKGVPNDGNFVSAAEAELFAGAPVDSFTVTLGQPVDIVPDDPPLADGVAAPKNDFQASNASGSANMNIYDPQRRWFSEVINTGGTGPAPMIQLLSRTRFSTAGGGEVAPSATPPATATFSTTLTRTAGSSLDALISSNGGRVRLVFRVLTNRSQDDEDSFVSGFTSSTRGAAIVDDVSVNAAGPNLITNGDFEAFDSIDNGVNGVYSNLTEGSASITAAVAGGFSGIANGSTVAGQDISTGTTVSSNDGTTIVLSAPVRNTLDDQTAVGASRQRYVYFGMSTALAAWKSTGKPPGVYVHPHCVNSNCASPGQWNDPCSPPNLLDARAPNRTCNMVGNVLSGGDHDNSEKPGGASGANDQDRFRLGVTPVIITATDPDPSQYNAHGLNRDIVTNSTEWALWFDIHTAGFRGSAVNGNHRKFGLQSYPATQTNGATCWGETRWSTATTFHTSNACIQNMVSLKQAGFVVTSNPSGIPDSIRVHVQYVSRCYTTALTPSLCSPTTGSFVGNYMDNFSFSMIRGSITAGLSNFPWMWFADAFPTYIDPGTGLPRTSFVPSDFDTATAKVKSAANRHVNTGSTSRPNVPGDSAQVTTNTIPGGGRVDLIFRIFPGPGNFTTVGDRLSAIRQVPTSITAAVGNAASSNFWESYMGNTGAFGTGGNGTTGGAHDPDGGGPIVAGTRWDWNAWNSARMDTLERNLWPCQQVSPNLSQISLSAGDWQTTYHELDPRFSTVGTAKNRCFMASPTGAASCKSRTPASTADCNLVCEDLPGGPPFDVWPPAWTGPAGLVAEGGLPLGQTYEFTKIIPDGQLTPGSHVQYFFRRLSGLNQAVDLWPDTTQIFDGASADGARWFHFSVLPDRWKDAAYGGEGLLCMLVIDNFDRQGDEFFWVSAADSIGLTSTAKRGAHNGWFAAGGQNEGNTFSQATLRRDNGGQPGTTWDLWNTKAGESITSGSAWLSNRWTTQPPAGSYMDGKQNTTGPTGPMLRHFYRSLVYLTGTANGYNFGAVSDRGDDDIAQLNDFVFTNPGGISRSVMAWGSGFASGLTGTGGAPIPAGGGTAFLGSFFGASETSTSYRIYADYPGPVAHYEENPNSAHDAAGGTSGLTYGVSNGCGIQNAVLAAQPSMAANAAVQTYYENYGTLGPYPASVYVPSGGLGSPHPHDSYLDGTRINRVGGYSPVLPLGRRNFLYYVLKNLWIVNPGACAPLPTPVGVGDDPSSAFANFLAFRSANPSIRGESRLAFGITHTERAEVQVFDVGGRLVKTVAKRIFQGGKEHVVIWDGTDQGGNVVRSGVYFYRVSTPTWTSQKKLTLLAR